MLVLFETPAGYALFKLLDDAKLKQPEDLCKHFETPSDALKTVKLKAFCKFPNTTEAVASATSLLEGKMSSELKDFLKKELVSKKVSEALAVGDTKLGSHISKKLGLKVVSDNVTMELMRGIRSQLASLIEGVSESDLNIMSLGLSHSLSRYKLKFSPDKVDTMIVQAISLLDDLDKELNTYCMRLKEWYGWHFPELSKIVVDNLAFCRTVREMGLRSNAATIANLSKILPEELETEVKQAAEISMGTEISEEDLDNIFQLCDQIISLSQYRAELYEYLKNRMLAIAPNLTCLVGDLVGARLIAHSGSLMNLAKHPASTVQILGAEKALFRALKTKHDTPKYGLIYHASLVGQAAPKLKGKISRVLAAKTALAIRVDALGEKDAPEIGAKNRLKVEERLRQLESQAKTRQAGSAKGKPNQKKFEFLKSATFNPANDVILKESSPSVPAAISPQVPDSPKKKKEKTKETAEEEKSKEKKKKSKISSEIEDEQALQKKVQEILEETDSSKKRKGDSKDPKKKSKKSKDSK